METVWIVGQFCKQTADGVVWEFQGVFDCKDKAESACIAENYFVATVIVNDTIAGETRVWPGCYYPIWRH